MTAELLDADALAMFLGVGRGTVDKLRKSGRIPFIRLGKKTIRFYAADVVSALKESQRTPAPRQGISSTPTPQ